MDLLDLRNELTEVEVVFSTWGMPVLDAQALVCLPRLKVVYYAAGSVKPSLSRCCGTVSPGRPTPCR